MKRFKKILTSIISMVLVIAMVGTSCVFASNSQAESKNIDIWMSYNSEFAKGRGCTDEAYKDYALCISFVDRKDGHATATVKLRTDKGVFVFNSISDILSVESEYGMAEYLSFSGDLTNKVFSDNNSVIDVSVVKTDDDNSFAVVNIGSIIDDSNPKTLFFGNYTDAIRSAYKSIIYTISSTNAKTGDNNQIQPDRTGDSSITYLNSKVYMSGNYTLGAVHLYGRTTFKAETNGRMVAKVNSYNNNAKGYVQANIAGNSEVALYAYPDQVKVRIKVTENNCTFVDLINGYPENNSTSVNLSVLSYALSLLSHGVTPSFSTITLSSITRSKSRSPIVKYDWTEYKMGGINNIEGSYSDPEGVGAYCYVYTDDILTNPETEVVSTSATIRYQYGVADDFDVYTGTITVGSLTSYANYPITIQPQ